MVLDIDSPKNFLKMYFILLRALFYLHVYLGDGVGSRGTGVTDGYELSHESLGPLGQQQVSLATEP